MINPSYFWLNVVFLSFGTLLIRFSIIAISSRVRISDRVKEIFSYIPACILPAFIAPAVFLHQGQIDWLLGKERLVVLVLSTIICYLTRGNTLATIGFGLATLYFVSL